MHPAQRTAPLPPCAGRWLTGGSSPTPPAPRSLSHPRADTGGNFPLSPLGRADTEGFPAGAVAAPSGTAPIEMHSHTSVPSAAPAPPQPRSEVRP